MNNMDDKKRGFVALVGAGPGNPGLLTLRARELLEKATVVVYDRLVSPEILDMIPESTRRIDVGKQQGKHPVPQEEINSILLNEGQKGETVVRLKGGDPFIFGRGGEELELLCANTVDFEVVPGITSAIAAPSFAGIPLTHRDYCSSLHIITGHQRVGKALDINFKALVNAGGTLVFLMGVSALTGICHGLLEAGMDENTPAALVENGTRPEQRRLIASLKELPKRAEEEKIASPAVIVVGKVCGLYKEYGWFHRLPLKGKTFIVTRPIESGGSLNAALSRLGAKTIACPCIRTKALEHKLPEISKYSWLVFTSKHGVRIFFEKLYETGMDARALAGIKLAVTGPQTAQELKGFGLKADFMPEVYDGQALGTGLAPFVGPNEQVLLVRAREGSPEIISAFSQLGISVCDFPLYETISLTESSALILEALEKEEKVYVSFTSASTVTGFVSQVPKELLCKVYGLCIGRQTAKAAQEAGIHCQISEEATVESLTELAERICRND